MSLIHSLVRKLVNHALHLYYSDIRVKDAHLVPEHKPVVFLINHSAGLCDVLMMLSQCPRIVNFWAAAFYRESPWLARLCNTLKFVPVTRAQERDRKKPLYSWPLKGNDAEATFEYSLSLLKKMECVALCPEGDTHTQSHMAHFRTGTARMLFEAAQQGMDSVLVQGCGLMYLDRGHARTPVVVEFGTPISVKQILERAGITTGGVLPPISEPLLEKITDVLQTEMKDVTINADDWPSVRALRTAAELYQPDHARLPLEMEMEIVQRFANKYAELKDKPDVSRAIESAKAYNDELDTLNAHDYHIKSQVTDFNQFVVKVLHLLLTLCWFIPGAIIGIPLHAPVYFLVSRAWKAIASIPGIDKRRLEGREIRQEFPHFLPGALDLADSMKIAIGVVLYIIGYIITTLIVAWYRGGWSSIIWIMIAPWLHAVTLRHVSEVIHCCTKLRTRLRLYANRTRVITLQQKRVQLQVVARNMVDQFADPELNRIFPKTSF